ncbi:benzoyl-CoA reductase/2-hydroxyglutaryl-CoA dehydratase subunit BcrC/BadD/HgdB [Rhodopseudomonas rhenobacensis]|uniref:Benzoyl-CoA reductase/2-hydroxyglutaryl-CoA dehydratase subunit BcrC/BadD/HgdB n=1 Tax=Rhodopseudomonas rhenobacensis TaxID=87461 RepID=A0A7W8DZ96_9BRAD|nr:2-hydroxyacyl-CoA dehydratase family protein [Rhodopseudomonas rhenobacensis]MBB5046671.1 benzoyl-CoA reductase/2-hydroxyglutaryl-CoA dehydratase subunit BcrC/BadD/HgdB [Rhodopseudomonas rhenobacensis]
MTRPDSIAAAVEDVLELHRDRLALLAGIDRPKIGYLSIQTPEEILLAAGAIPFRLTGEFSTETDGASVHLGSNYCSYVLSCFGEGLAGVYGFADAVVFVDACDMRKRLWETWARTVPGCESWFLELPNDASPLSKSFFAGQLRKLIRRLEQRYGRPIGEGALRDGIARCNRTRELMQRLYDGNKRGSPLLTGQQSIDLVKAATTGLKDEFNDRLAALLDAAASQQPRAGRPRHRVLICGSYFDQPAIVEVIEATGADIVCGDISNGVKYFEGRIDADAEPVAAIADYYLEKHTSARCIDTDIRLRHLFDLVRDYRVESVIYFALKFCDTNLHDYPYIKEKLREQQIPVLFIEGEHNGSNIASIKTRIETFLEPRFF